MKLINRIVLNSYQSLRSSLPYASQLLSREWGMSKNHVFAHSTHMLQPIELKPFSSSPVWKCGHFGTLEAKNGPFSPILEPFLWFFKKLVVLGKMGKNWGKWGRKKISFPSNLLPTYIPNYPESFSQIWELFQMCQNRAFSRGHHPEVSWKISNISNQVQSSEFYFKSYSNKFQYRESSHLQAPISLLYALYVTTWLWE